MSWVLEAIEKEAERRAKIHWEPMKMLGYNPGQIAAFSDFWNKHFTQDARDLEPGVIVSKLNSLVKK